MRTKFIILLAIVIVVALIWVYKFRSDEKTRDSVIETHVVEALPSDKLIKKIEEPILNNTNTKQSDLTTETTSQETSELLFSTDPVVNTYAIFRNNQLCYSQLENSNSPSIYMQQFLERMENKQAKYFQEYLDYCRKLDKEHPEYFLTNKDALLAKMKDAKPNSLWGKILNREIEVENLTQVEIQGLLKSKDINILQEAPQYFESYYQKVVHWDLESVLGNHDYDYVTYIRRYAHQVYMCDLGAQCQENSTIMANLCYINNSACGMDFTSYVNNSLTPGQQADIDLALSYLRNQYQ